MLSLWEREWSLPKSLQDNPSQLFIIDTPPPYTNAKWHLGGAIHYSQIDMIARSMRLMGKQVYFPMGLDRNGLPIEIAAEQEFGISMFSVPRKEFIGLCKKILDRLGDQTLDLVKRLGISCDSLEWDHVYRTDSDQFRALTQSTFIELYKKGLISENLRPTNWDPSLQSTIADAEIEYRIEKSELIEIAFLVPELGETHSFTTTRPELLPAIRAIIFNPDDARYRHLEGKVARVPLLEKEVPIIPHPSASQDYGTGLLQICSFGDLTDIRTLRELEIEPIYIIDPDGRLNEKAGKYQGMTIPEARRTIKKDLEPYILSKKKVMHRIPISERTGTPVEFLGMNEFYLKQREFVPILKRYATEVKFVPEQMRQRWLDWLESIKTEWPISRRRFYGTEIPLWYCNSCNETILPPPGRYYKPWAEPPPIQSCQKCGSESFKGETRTFDTWMDSSITVMYILKFPFNDQNLSIFDQVNSRNFLADIRPQGKDIIRTWLHYSFLRIHQLEGKRAFAVAWISGHVVSEKGERFSKRKGNSPDPEEFIDKYGADSLRLFGALETKTGSDIRFSETAVKASWKFLKKLFNLARFISSFEKPREYSLRKIDWWILEELNKVIETCKEGYLQFEFQQALRELRTFTQKLFASTYVEIVKDRAYNHNKKFNQAKSNGAKWTLHHVFHTILLLFSPIIPFTTDILYRKLNDGKTIFGIHFPKKLETDSTLSDLTDDLLAFNSFVWTFKKKQGLALNDPIADIEVPKKLSPFLEDLKSMHKLL